MANEQLSMTDILGDEKPKPETEVPAAPAEPAAAEPDAAAREAAEEQRREDYKSRRGKARDKEAIAQGKVRDPDTGQFVSPKAEAAPAAQAAPAAPAEPATKVADPAKPAAAAPAQPEFTDREKAFLRAVQEERAKRQELERRIAAGGAPTQPAAPTEPAKKFWDDPEGMLAKHKQEVEQVGVNTRLQTAEMIARQRHPDFGEKLAEFSKVLEQTPGLHVQWLASQDPAEFAYNVGKTHLELREVGSIDELKAKIKKEAETEVRAKIEAEMKAKDEALEKDRAALPPSLSDARAGAANRQIWSGPPSMSDILK